MVTVQYANRWIQNMSMQDFQSIPLRGMAIHTGYSPAEEGGWRLRYLKRHVDRAPIESATPRSVRSPTSALINTPRKWTTTRSRRVIDIYVATKSEALGGAGKRIRTLIANTPTDRKHPHHAPWRRGQHE